MKEESPKETLSKTRAKMLDMLTRREYSRAELREKALAWLLRQRKNGATEAFSRTSSHYTPTQAELDEVERVLDELAEKGWQSDGRFVESFMNQRSSRLGANRVRQELRQKGVNEDQIDEALSELGETEYERAMEVWGRKFKTTPQDQKEYARQMRFMVYRGFSADLVVKILTKA